MVETIGIFRGGERIYSSSPLEPLLLDVVSGLNEIARRVYNDELVYLEMDGYNVNSFVGPKDVVVVSVSKDRGRRDLRHIYEAYCVCMAYDDMDLMDVLLSVYRGVGR